MTVCVLDASAAIAMVLKDETTELDEWLLQTVRSGGASVTALWHLEVADVLLIATQRGRISAEKRATILRVMDRLPLEIDENTAAYAWKDT